MLRRLERPSRNPVTMRSTLLAAALAAPLALAASAVAATQETTPAADSFDGLRAEFDQLSRYLMSRRGIGTAERQELLALRRQLDAYAAANPDDARPTVLDLQISLWLGEDDRVDAAFATILDRSPDNTAIRRRWAQARGQANRWDAALEVLSDPSLAGMPEAMLDQARMLMNLNRFAEALAVLEQLPTDGEGAATVASQATALKLQLETLAEAWAVEEALLAAEAEKNDLPRVSLDTGKGVIVLELFEDQAPYTVANFIELVEGDFYDGTKFHRVLPGFMAQGGDPNTIAGASGAPGQGGPGYTIPDESSRSDKRKHFAGRLAMAKPSDPERPGKAKPNSAGSQFYITVVPTSHLDEEYTVFGRVIEGDDIARSLRIDDLLRSATVLRKRDSEYKPVKLGQTTPASTAATEDDASNASSQGETAGDSASGESASGG
jgi:cyclophilin family peptidyl-prolyl cis-trans isomerase